MVNPKFEKRCFFFISLFPLIFQVTYEKSKNLNHHPPFIDLESLCLEIFPSSYIPVAEKNIPSLFTSLISLFSYQIVFTVSRVQSSYSLLTLLRGTCVPDLINLIPKQGSHTTTIILINNWFWWYPWEVLVVNLTCDSFIIYKLYKAWR